MKPKIKVSRTKTKVEPNMPPWEWEDVKPNPVTTNSSAKDVDPVVEARLADSTSHEPCPRRGVISPTADIPLSSDTQATQVEIATVCDEVKAMLLEKNRKYGNSALDPVRFFSRASPIEQLKVRLDDKLSRLRSAQTDDTEDSESDLMGYLVLLRVAKRLTARNDQRAANASTEPNVSTSKPTVTSSGNPSVPISVSVPGPGGCGRVQELDGHADWPEPMRAAVTGFCWYCGRHDTAAGKTGKV